ncbi:hypothetical protein [Paenibacillus sp. DMB20]|uniref:hypothetical protein n=1 Tax=Paenibacillus sp. DMB20 TaxID=1642570 RepID=UPI0006276B78|nr:hypothetical protein [Paenibacillus sp. DMB20]KKO54177.1 hypothetical protein XI25_08950 [Paenibacillus sp. DMB20]
MKRLLLYVLLLSLLNGCTDEKGSTRDTAEENALEHVPPCGNGLQTFNRVTDARQTGNEYIIKIERNCEPENGEGPKMETVYAYSVTPEEVKLLE